MKISKVPLAALGLAALFSAGAAMAAPSYSLFGDASLVAGNGSPTGAQITSNASLQGYGGVSLAIPSGLIFAGLATLSSDYKITAGSCGGGAPRFSVKVIDPSTHLPANIFVYFGTAPDYNDCPLNIWTNTGDLLEPGLAVDSSQLVGGGFYQSYSDALTAFGAASVVSVSLVVDGYWKVGTQTASVDNVNVGGSITTFEPPPTADDCKKNGWQTLVSAGSPFKNQGACVSSFSRAK